MKRIALGLAAAALSLAVVACGSSSDQSTATNSPSTTPTTTTETSTAPKPSGGIVINNYAYSGTLTVKPGQKVTVTNDDSVAHTVTDKKSQMFDTGNIDGNGGTGTFTAPTKPGSYPFGCTYHPDMAGTLIVKA